MTSHVTCLPIALLEIGSDNRLLIKPPGLQASIFCACPKPGYIGRVVPGRAFRIKWWRWQRLGCQLVGMGWQSIWIVGVSAYVIFILLQNIQKRANKDTNFHMPMQTGGGETQVECSTALCYGAELCKWWPKGWWTAERLGRYLECWLTDR